MNREVMSVIDTVNRLNERVDVYTELFEWTPLLVFQSVGWVDYVLYLGEIIWNSDDDERDYIDETDEYAPLDDFLVGKIDAMHTSLGMCLTAIRENNDDN